MGTSYDEDAAPKRLREGVAAEVGCGEGGGARDPSKKTRLAPESGQVAGGQGNGGRTATAGAATPPTPREATPPTPVERLSDHGQGGPVHSGSEVGSESADGSDEDGFDVSLSLPSLHASLAEFNTAREAVRAEGDLQPENGDTLRSSGPHFDKLHPKSDDEESAAGGAHRSPAQEAEDSNLQQTTTQRTASAGREREPAQGHEGASIAVELTHGQVGEAPPGHADSTHQSQLHHLSIEEVPGLGDQPARRFPSKKVSAGMSSLQSYEATSTEGDSNRRQDLREDSLGASAPYHAADCNDRKVRRQALPTAHEETGVSEAGWGKAESSSPPAPPAEAQMAASTSTAPPLPGVRVDKGGVSRALASEGQRSKGVCLEASAVVSGGGRPLKFVKGLVGGLALSAPDGEQADIPQDQPMKAGEALIDTGRGGAAGDGHAVAGPVPPGRHDLVGVGIADPIGEVTVKEALGRLEAIDLKQSRITYKWDLIHTYSGRLGGRIKSDKSRKRALLMQTGHRQEVWYNVSWDDNSRNQIQLHQSTCILAASDEQQQALCDSAPGFWCIDEDSLLQSFRQQLHVENRCRIAANQHSKTARGRVQKRKGGPGHSKHQHLMLKRKTPLAPPHASHGASRLAGGQQVSQAAPPLAARLAGVAAGSSGPAATTSRDDADAQAPAGPAPGVPGKARLEFPARHTKAWQGVEEMMQPAPAGAAASVFDPSTDGNFTQQRGWDGVGNLPALMGQGRKVGVGGAAGSSKCTSKKMLKRHMKRPVGSAALQPCPRPGFADVCGYLIAKADLVAGVEERGGFEVVTQQKLWSELGRQLGIDVKAKTATGHILKKRYLEITDGKGRRGEGEGKRGGDGDGNQGGVEGHGLLPSAHGAHGAGVPRAHDRRCWQKGDGTRMPGGSARSECTTCQQPRCTCGNSASLGGAGGAAAAATQGAGTPGTPVTPPPDRATRAACDLVPTRRRHTLQETGERDRSFRRALCCSFPALKNAPRRSRGVKTRWRREEAPSVQQQQQQGKHSQVPAMPRGRRVRRCSRTRGRRLGRMSLAASRIVWAILRAAGSVGAAVALALESQKKKYPLPGRRVARSLVPRRPRA